jgi:2-succinyl-6-hydroxy-2,4-cyclohexadiene-1-carboxylate synthase
LPKLYFLHGFAGDPHDWDGVISHLSGYECIPLSYPFQLQQSGILIGYSMGGRIALHSDCPKIVIGGHPGLRAQEEIKTRLVQDHYWIEKLKSASIQAFFKEWYSQPLFASLQLHSIFPSLLERRYKQTAEILIQQLKTHSLAHPSPNPKNAFFIHGALDKAYRDLYLERQISSQGVEGAGHACHLENPLETAQQIKKYIDIIKLN